MLSAVLATAGTAPLLEIAQQSGANSFGAYMQRVLPHPEHRAIVLAQSENDWFFHPVQGLPFHVLAHATRSGVWNGHSWQMMGNGVDRNRIDMEGTNISNLGIRAEHRVDQGNFFSGHANVSWPLNRSHETQALPANALQLPKDSSAYVALQEGGSIFTGRPEIVLVRNRYGVILSTGADGNIVCSAHFFIGCVNDFNGDLGQVPTITNLILGAGSKLDGNGIQALTQNMRSNSRYRDDVIRDYFVEKMNITTNASSKLPSNLVIAAAEMSLSNEGRSYRVLVIKMPHSTTEAPTRQVDLGESLSALAIKFGYANLTNNSLTAEVIETATAFARVVGENR